METFLLIWLTGLTVYVFSSNRSIQKNTKAILHAHSALFWALKNKKVLNVEDLKEGNRVVRGEKMGDMSLNDFIDMQKP